MQGKIKDGLPVSLYGPVYDTLLIVHIRRFLLVLSIGRQ